MSEQQSVGRLALRHEGDLWVAYWALPDTMEGAILIGSINFSAIADNDEIRERFVDLMQYTLSMAITDITGGVSGWSEPTAAPEHERAGHS